MDDAETGSADAAEVAQQVQAEVAAEAERLRQEDPDLARRELDLECAWVANTPFRGGDDDSGELLERAERYVHTDLYAAHRAGRGLRRLRQALPTLTYWYRRYLAGQVNAWNHAVVSWMRQAERRLRTLEAAQSPWLAAGAPSLDGTSAAAPEDRRWADLFTVADLDPNVTKVAVDEMAAASGLVAASGLAAASGLVAVLGCGEGAAVRALDAAGVAAYGVDPHSRRITAGIDSGLDLRTGEILDHLVSLPDGVLGGVVLAGAATSVPVSATVAVVAQAVRVTAQGGSILVVAADPKLLPIHERDLRAGRGVLWETWLHLLEQAGCGSCSRLYEGIDPFYVITAVRR